MINRMSLTIGTTRFIGAAALSLSAYSLSGCRGKVIQPEVCQNLSQSTCSNEPINISVADPAYQPYEPYLIDRTNQLLAAINPCAHSGLQQIVFTPNTVNGAAGERVCLTYESTDGNSQTACSINISTIWMDKEKHSIDPGVPHFWEYSLFHELGHQVFSNICDRGGFETISFDAHGLPASNQEQDFIYSYSPFPDYKFPSALAFPKEDFAYSFASFIMDRDQFRKKAGQSVMMAEKYEVLKEDFFAGQEFTTAP